VTELERLAAALDAAVGGGVPVLATLTSVEGSAYRGPGARMVVAPDGAQCGAISGGCLEKDIVAHAEAARKAGVPRLAHWDLARDDDAPWGLDMGCAARLAVLLEPCPAGAPRWLRAVLARHGAREAAVVVVDERGSRFEAGEPGASAARRARRAVLEAGVLYDYLAPPPLLAICGDGPDTAPLIALGAALGWRVVHVGREDALPPLDALTAVVVMSHNFTRDLALLGAAMRSGAAYVGVLGPRRRTERLLGELGEVSRDASALERLAAPVGLDLGAESPEEIALAVLAEIRAVLAGRPGGRLRERRGPIHERT
jgi:xanthine dehydrogenase accessory factor